MRPVTSLTVQHAFYSLDTTDCLLSKTDVLALFVDVLTHASVQVCLWYIRHGASHSLQFRSDFTDYLRSSCMVRVTFSISSVHGLWMSMACD